MIPVAEIFGPTIQGEGPHVGMKTMFVRVVGCDFKCAWCDSKFAWKADKNTKLYTSEQLTEELISHCIINDCYNVVLTGGNPCLYDFSNVVNTLHEHNITVDVETQGSKLPDWLNDIDLLVISPKAPSSKQPDVYDNIKKFFDKQPTVDIAIKIPVFNDEDFKFAEKYYELVEEYQGWVDVNLYLSVGNTNTSEEGDISQRILSDYENLINKACKSKMKRLFILPQVHTLVWGNRQGV